MKVAATSSSEAEIIAAVESVKTAVHFRALLEELGLCKVKHIDVYEDKCHVVCQQGVSDVIRKHDITKRSSGICMMWFKRV